MDMTEIVTGSAAILSLFVGLPAIVLSFVYKNKKHKRETEIEKLKYQKEILELENKKLDRIINGA